MKSQNPSSQRLTEQRELLRLPIAISTSTQKHSQISRATKRQYHRTLRFREHRSHLESNLRHPLLCALNVRRSLNMPSTSDKAVQKMKATMPEVDLEQPLSGSEDASLADEQLMLEQFLEVEFQKPPGINNLRSWGEVILPAGKLKGRSHAEAYDFDLAYAVLMAKKQTLSSPWALSYHNYVLARLKATARCE